MRTVRMIRPSDGATVPILFGDCPGLEAAGFAYVDPADRELVSPSPLPALVKMTAPNGAGITVGRGEVQRYEDDGYTVDDLELRAKFLQRRNAARGGRWW